jgi:hypothetical protein
MAQALQGECMDVWNITIGKFMRCFFFCEFRLYFYAADMLMFDNTNYNVTTMPKNLKVLN